MNIVEKILAKASGRPRVAPGEIVEAKVNVAMIHDLTGPLTIEAFRRIGVKKVWDPKKIVIIFDHDVPPCSIKSAANQKRLREFAKEQEIGHLYDAGEGICHLVLYEKGHVKPGELIVGADSHTVTHGFLGAFATGIGATEMAAVFSAGEIWLKVPEVIKFNIKGRLRKFVTPKDIILSIIGSIGADGASYKAMLFNGSAVDRMSLDGRATLCNMSVEAGSKVGIIEPDEKSLSYVKERTSVPFKPIKSDPDSFFSMEIDVDVSNLEPQISLPHAVDNVKSVSEVGDVEIDAAFLGSCTGGRLDDLRLATQLLKGKKVKEGVRLIVVPGSREVYYNALREGLIEIFLRAGALVCSPGCGPCIGLSRGIMADEEVCISAANRNFKGRMGSPNSFVYLASPATVAASSITGKITDPRLLSS